jgi:nucleotide-binding universal stress UspA family protein
MNRILIAIDGSQQSLAAVRWVASAYSPETTEIIAASTYGLEPAALMAGYVPAPDWGEKWSADLETHLNGDWTAPLRDKGFSVRACVLEGHAEDTLLLIARDDRVDLIVVGCRGRGSVKEMFLGSVSHFLVTHAPCPVVVIPPAVSSRDARPAILATASHD